jgi:two-component system NtrC family sensor kinase
MRRREFIAGLGIAGLGGAAALLVARGQQNGRVRALQLQILRLQAEGIAETIGHFINETENQIGWTTVNSWSESTIEQRRFDGLRLVRQVPAIAKVAQLDPTGKERLRVSRGLAMDLEDDHADYSHDPKFTEALAKKVYYGPMYLRGQSPFMTLSVAGPRREAGVTVVEVSLRRVWDTVSHGAGERRQAYVIDTQGRLIAHTDVDLVLSNTDMRQLAQVRAARTDGAGAGGEAKDINDRNVLTAYAPVAPPGWLVFVEMPIEEAK